MAVTGPRQTSVCRDCYAEFSGARQSCPQCRSIRTYSHPQLSELAVAHVDCDAFYASIEKRDNPELVAKPVIVGGGKRGVVSTCCYIARTYGVRSAMPMFKALKACPNAVVIRPRMSVYAEEGRKIREMMLELTPIVEPVSIDEAYLDLTGTEKLHGHAPAVSLMALQRRVERELRLTISVGLSVNKFLAKTASEMDKPRGFCAISAEEAPGLLAPMSVRVIGGVGPALEKKLNAAGIATVGDIQRLDAREMVKRFGETGLWLHNCAFGRHARKVTTGGERKTVSTETTLFEDVSDAAALEDLLWKLSQRTADRAKAAGVDGRVVNLKLKTASFKTISRQTQLHAPTQLAQSIFRAARPLLAKEATGAKYRLIGVGLSELSPAGGDALDLADPKALKRAGAERAADVARSKFGEDAVRTGRAVRSQGPKPD